MKRQRNTTQMKEQTRRTEVQINEEELGKLPEKEFKIMIVKMIKNLENKIQHHPTTSSTLSHLNNKQNKNTHPVISRQNYHLTQPSPSEEKQTTTKNLAQISPYMKLTQTTGSILGGQKPNGRQDTTLKPGKRRQKGREILHK